MDEERTEVIYPIQETINPKEVLELILFLVVEVEIQYLVAPVVEETA